MLNRQPVIDLISLHNGNYVATDEFTDMAALMIKVYQRSRNGEANSFQAWQPGKTFHFSGKFNVSTNDFTWIKHSNI